MKGEKPERAKDPFDFINASWREMYRIMRIWPFKKRTEKNSNKKTDGVHT